MADQETASAPPLARGASAWPPASIAFALGWQMSELYAGGSPDQTRPQAPVKTLPTLTRLSGSELTSLGLDQVDAGLFRLRPQLDAANIAVIDTKPVRQEVATAGTADAVRRVIAGLHVETMLALTAADFRLGKAYGLGRSLADTATLPAALDALEYVFGPRLDVIKGWLADLSSTLPPHACQAAAASLTAWDRWAADPKVNGAAMDWDRDAATVRAALQHQGRLWRALLSGEKDGADMLTTAALVQAGKQMVSSAADLALRSLASLLPLVIGVVVLIAGGVSLLVLAKDDLLRIGGSFLAALGSVGLTWKQVTTSAGKLAGGLEMRLWSAEVDRAIAVAITVGPPGWEIDVGEVAEALPPAGEGPRPDAGVEVIMEFCAAVEANRLRSQRPRMAHPPAAEDRLHPYARFLGPGGNVDGRVNVLEWLDDAANRKLFSAATMPAAHGSGCFIGGAGPTELWHVRHNSVTRWQLCEDEASARQASQAASHESLPQPPAAG